MNFPMASNFAGTTFTLFQMHKSGHMHGQANRIRYDYETCTGGFSQKRFDDMWGSVDKNKDGKMDYKEMCDMCHNMTNPEGVQNVNFGEWPLKIGTFGITYFGLDG